MRFRLDKLYIEIFVFFIFDLYIIVYDIGKILWYGNTFIVLIT